jgi:hypothetical protein
MARTNCECPLAGYCNRHGVNKTPHQHKLCQNHPTVFKAWEEGRGPGQENGQQEPPRKKVEPKPVPTTKVKTCSFCNGDGCNGECRNQNKTPSMFQMAKNLAGSMKDAAKDGFTTNDVDETERRMEICRGCEFYIPDQNRCSKCGCKMAFKSKLRSAHCPVGKWAILFACLFLF